MCEPETDHLAEKIIVKINEAFENDELQQMEILPVPVKVYNTTPIVVEQQVLGIESWCLAYVSNYSYRRVMYWRKKKASIRRFESLKHYLNLVLFANPEIASIWNTKRELIEKGYKFVDSDLYLTKVMLSLYPKSAQILAYRRWLSKFVQIAEDFISEEFHICSVIAEKKANNYHAWAHRWWLLETVCVRPQFSNFLRIEVLFTNVWVKKNVSQFSGLHYLFNLVKKTCELPLALCGFVQYMYPYVINRDLVQNRRLDSLFWEKLELILKMLMFNYNLIMYHPEHESLWLHRQCLITFIIEFMYYHMEPKTPPSPLVRQQPAPSPLSSEIPPLLRQLLPSQPLSQPPPQPPPSPPPPTPSLPQQTPFPCSHSDSLEQMYKKTRFHGPLHHHIEEDADLVHIMDNPFVRKHVKWLLHHVKIFSDE